MCFLVNLLHFQALKQTVLDRSNVLVKVYNYRYGNIELHNQILETFQSNLNICFKIHGK